MRSLAERQFPLRDGIQLFYRHWPGREPKAIVLLHRGHEHSGRMTHVAEELDLPDGYTITIEIQPQIPGLPNNKNN